MGRNKKKKNVHNADYGVYNMHYVFSSCVQLITYFEEQYFE